MFVPAALYAVAAAFDIRKRRVPNVLWVVLLAWCLVRGVPALAWLFAAYLGVAGYYAWKKDELGGADVKALALLPLALPALWPIAILGAIGVAFVQLHIQGRDEIPFVVPVLVGVCAASGLALWKLQG